MQCVYYGIYTIVVAAMHRSTDEFSARVAGCCLFMDSCFVWFLGDVFCICMCIVWNVGGKNNCVGWLVLFAYFHGLPCDPIAVLKLSRLAEEHDVRPNVIWIRSPPTKVLSPSSLARKKTSECYGCHRRLQRQ